MDQKQLEESLLYALLRAAREQLVLFDEEQLAFLLAFFGKDVAWYQEAKTKIWEEWRRSLERS